MMSMEGMKSYDDEHEGFAARSVVCCFSIQAVLKTDTLYIFSRSSEYVFAVTKDKFYNDLDLHADTVEGDVKLPLVVYGDEG